MKEQREIQMIEDAYAAFGKGDIDGVLNPMAPDVEWWVAGQNKVTPYAGVYRGHDGVRQFFTELARTEEVLQFTPLEFIARGDRVVVLGHYQGLVKANGRVFDSDWAHVFTFKGGKITGFREYFDTASAVLAYTEKAA